MADKSKWSEAQPGDDPESTMVLIPVGSTIFEPDDIHQVTVQFPDKESAIVYWGWLCDLCSQGKDGD